MRQVVDYLKIPEVDAAAYTYATTTSATDTWDYYYDYTKQTTRVEAMGNIYISNSDVKKYGARVALLFANIKSRDVMDQATKQMLGSVKNSPNWSITWATPTNNSGIVYYSQNIVEGSNDK